MREYWVEVNFIHKSIEKFKVLSDNNTHAILNVLNNLSVDDKEQVVKVAISYIGQ